MAISIVQSAVHMSNPPAAFSGGVTAGNTVFLVYAGYTTNGSNVTTSAPTLGGSSVSGSSALFAGGGANTVNSASDGGNVAGISIWMLPNVPGGGTSVGLTVSGNAIGQAIYEVSGLSSSPALDQSSSGSSITAAVADSGTTGAITAAPELILGAAMIFSGAGAGSPPGFTTLNSGDLWAGYQIAASSGGTYDWQQSSAGQPWAAVIATIQGAAGTPHTATGALTVTPAFAIKKAEAHVESLILNPAFAVVKAEGHKQALTVTPGGAVVFSHTGQSLGGSPDRHHHRAGPGGR